MKGSGDGMKTIAIRLDDNQHEQLQLICNARGVTIISVIRDLVDGFIEDSLESKQVQAAIDQFVQSELERINNLRRQGDGK